MKRNYHTIDNRGKVSERRLAEFLSKNGQQLLPLVELVEQSRLVIDNLIEVTGRATIQAVLELSAEQVVGGPRQQGKARTGEIVRYGYQAGTVNLARKEAAGRQAATTPEEQRGGSGGDGATLHKDTALREGMALQFRAEFFNLFNHAQFNNPNGNFNSSLFGYVTSARDPRIGQMSLKFLW